MFTKIYKNDTRKRFKIDNSETSKRPNQGDKKNCGGFGYFGASFDDSKFKGVFEGDKRS